MVELGAKLDYEPFDIKFISEDCFKKDVLAKMDTLIGSVYLSGIASEL